MWEFSFKKKERLRLKKDFDSVFQKGKSYANKYIVMYVKEREQHLEEERKKGFLESRIGIITKKKIGKAIERNRIRRLIREVFRLNKEKLIKPLDMIIIVRIKMENMKYWQMEKIILDLWKKAKII